MGAFVLADGCGVGRIERDAEVMVWYSDGEVIVNR